MGSSARIPDWHMPAGNALILAYSRLAYANWECPHLARTGNNKAFLDGTALAYLFPVGYAIQECAKIPYIREWHMPFVNGRARIREWDNSWLGQNSCLHSTTPFEVQSSKMRV
jgi:hypothetical protein